MSPDRQAELAILLKREAELFENRLRIKLSYNAAQKSKQEKQA